MEEPVKPPPPPKPGHLKPSKTFSIGKDGKPEISPKPCRTKSPPTGIPRSLTEGSISTKVSGPGDDDGIPSPKPRTRPVPRKRKSVGHAVNINKETEENNVSQERLEDTIHCPSSSSHQLDTSIPCEENIESNQSQSISDSVQDNSSCAIAGESKSDASNCDLDIAIPCDSRRGLAIDDHSDELYVRQSKLNHTTDDISLDVQIPNNVRGSIIADDSVFSEDSLVSSTPDPQRYSYNKRTPSYDQAVLNSDSEETVDLILPIAAEPEPQRPPRNKKKHKRSIQSLDLSAASEEMEASRSTVKSPHAGLAAIAAKKTPPVRPKVPPKPKPSPKPSPKQPKLKLQVGIQTPNSVPKIASRTPSYGAALENGIGSGTVKGRDRYHSRSLEDVKTESLDRLDDGQNLMREESKSQGFLKVQRQADSDGTPDTIKPSAVNVKHAGPLALVVGELNQKLNFDSVSSVSAAGANDGDEGVFEDEYDDVVVSSDRSTVGKPVPRPRSNRQTSTESSPTPKLSMSLDTPIPNPRDSCDTSVTLADTDKPALSPVRKAPPPPSLTQTPGKAERESSGSDLLDRCVPSPEDYSDGYLPPAARPQSGSSDGSGAPDYTYIDVPDRGDNKEEDYDPEDVKLPMEAKKKKSGKIVSSIYDAVSGTFGSLGRSHKQDKSPKSKKRISSVFYYEIDESRRPKGQASNETSPSPDDNMTDEAKHSIHAEYVNEPYVNEQVKPISSSPPKEPPLPSQPAPPPRANRRAAENIKSSLPLPPGLNLGSRPLPDTPGINLENTDPDPDPDLKDENEYVLPEDLEDETESSPGAEGLQVPPRQPRPHSDRPVNRSPIVNLDTHPVMLKHRSAASDSDYSYPKTTFLIHKLDKSPSAAKRPPGDTTNSSSNRSSSSSNDSDDYIYPETAIAEPPSSEGDYSVVEEDGKETTSPGETATVKRRNPPVQLGQDSHSSGDSGRSSSRPTSWGAGRESTFSTRQYMDMSRENLADLSYVNHSHSSSMMSPDSAPSTPVCRSASNISGMSAISSTSSADAEGDQGDEESTLSEKELRAAKRRRKAFNVAEEIMTSEQTFVEILRLLNEDFRRGVVEMSTKIRKAILPQPTLDQILKHLPQLQYFNETLLQDLTQRVINWEKKPQIADVFVRKGPFLKMYTDYIRDNQAMISTLDEAQKRYPEFNLYVESFEQSPKCCMLKVKHHMLKPIQRIPQYRLLLQDYKKQLDEDSPDYKDTITAIAIVSDVAEHANDSMKYGETLSKFLEIQNNLIGQFEVIKPGRNLIKEGMLNKMSRKEVQPRKLYLFNDVLLYCTPVSGGFKLNNELSLVGMKVSIPTKEDFQNEFSIISTQRSFTMSSETPQERDEWLEALETTIAEMKHRRYSYDLRQTSIPEADIDFKLGYKAPVWIPDARVSMCQRCRAEFTVTFRRHHCRSCGKVVCASCSDCRAPLRYLKYRPARVCIECFQQLSKDVEEMPVPEEEKKMSEEDKKVSAFSRDSIKAAFRRETWGSFGRGILKRGKPAVLNEVKANDEETDMSGYLKVWNAKKSKWKKLWFVVKQNVLYKYRASEDIAASESTPLLGYEVRPFNTLRADPSGIGKKEPWFQGIESSLLFEVMHRGMRSMIFRTESPLTRDKWMLAIRNATIPQ